MKRILFLLAVVYSLNSNAQQMLVSPSVSLWSAISFQVQARAILVDSSSYVDFPLSYWIELTSDTSTLANFDSTTHFYYDKNDNNFQFYNVINSGFSNKIPDTWYFFREHGTDTFGNHYYSHYVAAKTDTVITVCDTCQTCEECDSLYRQTYFNEYFTKFDSLTVFSPNPPQWAIDSSRAWAKMKADSLYCRISFGALPDSVYSLDVYLDTLQYLPYCPTCPIVTEQHDKYVALNNYCNTYPAVLPGTILLLVCPATGIEELNDLGNVCLYPNPASTQLFIQTNSIEIQKLNIYNTTGSLVSQTKQPQNKSIDISDLASGIYIAEIKTKEASVRKKWIKM